MKTQTGTSSTANYVRNLHGRINAVRKKRTMVKLVTGIASSVAILIGAFAVEALLDEFTELPWLVRAFVLLGIIAGTGYELWRQSIVPFLNRPTDDSIALMIEHALPIFRTRFIASVQLARVFKESPPPLVRALLAETVATVLRVNFGVVVKTARMKRRLRAAFGIVIVAALLAWWGGPASVLLFKRAILFNIPLPHKTQIVSVTGNLKIGMGEDCTIQVTAAGITPPKGRVMATMASGQVHEFPLVADAKHHEKYTAVIHSPQDSFSYYVKLNDATSDTYHVTTVQRPAVVSVECEQIYPSYVKRPPVKRSPGDLSLLAGSKLNVNIKASMPVSQGTLFLVGLDQEVPLKIEPNKKLDLSGQISIPAKNLTGFMVRLTNTDGVVSGESATYRIDLLPDHEPTIKILRPSRREELAVTKAKELIAFEAKDDFGISKAEIHYSVDGGPEKTIPFEFGENTETTLKRHFDWELGKFTPPLVVGNVIEFWLTVADSNTVTGPGIGTTDHYQIRVVTSDEKLQDIDNRRHMQMQNIQEIERSQQEVNQDLGQQLFERPK